MKKQKLEVHVCYFVVDDYDSHQITIRVKHCEPLFQVTPITIHHTNP